MSACTFFGHHDCPSSIKPKLREVLVDLIENHAVDMFYVGQQGVYDANKTVTLQETSVGTFEFPKNSSSPSHQRCVYIPVETKDGTYTLTLTFTATKADGTALTEMKTSTITVKGSMYEDDFTGDS